MPFSFAVNESIPGPKTVFLAPVDASLAKLGKSMNPLRHAGRRRQGEHHRFGPRGGNRRGQGQVGGHMRKCPGTVLPQQRQPPPAPANARSILKSSIKDLAASYEVFDYRLRIYWTTYFVWILYVTCRTILSVEGGSTHEQD
jgi:hypothetical protein